MKRALATKDSEWEVQLKNRQITAAIRMLTEDFKKGFATLDQVYKAASFWKVSLNEAENRLMTGDIPDKLMNQFINRKRRT